MRVLALVPGGINEQLNFFPTLEEIKRAFPNAEIDVVTEPRAKSAYRLSKAVDEVIQFDYCAQNSPADWANLLGVVRDREFEVVLSVSKRWTEGLLLWLSGIPSRVTYSSNRAPWFYTQTIADKADQLPADRYHDLLQALSITSSCPNITVSVPERDIAWAEATRQQLALESGYVLINPTQVVGGDVSTAAYPIESWVTIIEDLQAKQPQLPVVILKTSENKSEVTDLVQQMPTIKVIASENIGQVAAMIAGANLLITPESFVLQLSMALKVFTLALLTANRSGQILSSPEGDPETRVLGVESSSQALADLKPDTVLQKVWGG